MANFTRFAAVIDTGFDIQVQVKSFDKALKHELESLSLAPEVVPFLILVLLVYGRYQCGRLLKEHT